MQRSLRSAALAAVCCASMLRAETIGRVLIEKTTTPAPPQGQVVQEAPILRGFAIDANDPDRRLFVRVLVKPDGQPEQAFVVKANLAGCYSEQALSKPVEFKVDLAAMLAATPREALKKVALTVEAEDVSSNVNPSPSPEPGGSMRRRPPSASPSPGVAGPTTPGTSSVAARSDSSVTGFADIEPLEKASGGNGVAGTVPGGIRWATLRRAVDLDLSRSMPPAQDDEKIVKKVCLIIADPVLQQDWTQVQPEAVKGKKLHEAMGWQDPQHLAELIAADFKETSGGILEYQIVKTIVDEPGWSRFRYDVPGAADPRVYDEKSFFADVVATRAKITDKPAWSKNVPEHHGMFDYEHLLKKHKIVEAINAREYDEVWHYGGPWFGMWESHMVGPKAYWVNSWPYGSKESGGSGDGGAQRGFIVMGLNYERGVGEALESFGHRAESNMKQAYGLENKSFGHRVGRKISSIFGRGKSPTDWEQFFQDGREEGKAGVGSLHFAPNSQKDYEWGRDECVVTTADDWLLHPKRTGRKVVLRKFDWAPIVPLWSEDGGASREHHKWWFRHLPRAQGHKDGRWNNWWKYFANPDSVHEKAK